MFQRIKNSWELLKASWQVLLAERGLIVFPIISFVTLIIVCLSFFIPALMTGLLQQAHDGNVLSQIFGFIILFAFYVVSYTVIFYCNTALIGCALIRLRGGDPTVQNGFQIANNNFNAIVGYALLAATVGLFLQWLRERGVLGRWVAGFFGMAWNIATFLVVPVLINEKNIGPLAAVKHSTALLKKTWGEQITGNVGINAVFGLLIVATTFLGITFCIKLVSISMALALIMGIFVGIAVISLSILSFTLNGIFTAAVYHYAVTGKADAFFKQDQIMNAFIQGQVSP